ncbi:hypothetical protein Tco_1008808 [Tanacetum coccineum]
MFPGRLIPNEAGLRIDTVVDVKALPTRAECSESAYERARDLTTIPPTPSPLPKEVERETEATKDKVQNTCSKSTSHVQPPVVQVSIPEPEVAPKPNPKPSIPYPSRLNNQKLSDKANNQMLKFLQIFQILHFDISFAMAPRRERERAELDKCLALVDLGASINLLPLSVWEKISLPDLTLTRMTLELAN